MTLGFSSGHDLEFREFKFRVGLCAAGAKPAGDSLSLSFNKQTNKQTNKLKKKF